MTKEINLLPPKGHEVLIGVKTNKFGDITCEKYKSVTPRLSIDGVRAMLDQINVVPPKEKKRKVPSTLLENKEKHPRMSIALLKKKIKDLSDEEHVYRKSLQQDLNALNHFVAKMRK